MIKFFRKIRYDLMKQNKNSRYFKYALGEIILVVIGILIALSINNWNEGRKNKAFEKEILMQIQVNLIKDKLTLEDIKTNFENAMASTDNIINATWTPEEKDSLKYWLGDIIQFDRFQPLTNAYEVAKSKGLDLISNKQLRFLIGTYYDDDAKQVGKSIEDIERTFHTEWTPLLRKEAQEAEFKNYVILKDINILKNDSQIMNTLRINKGNFKGGYERLKKVITIIEKIQDLINKELN